MLTDSQVISVHQQYARTGSAAFQLCSMQPSLHLQSNLGTDCHLPGLSLTPLLFLQTKHVQCRIEDNGQKSMPGGEGGTLLLLKPRSCSGTAVPCLLLALHSATLA